MKFLHRLADLVEAIADDIVTALLGDFSIHVRVHKMQVTITANSVKLDNSPVDGGPWQMGYTLPDGSASVQANTQTPHAVFDVAPGDYIAFGQRLDVNGMTPVGPRKEAPFTVPVPTFSVDVADSIEVVVG